MERTLQINSFSYLITWSGLFVIVSKSRSRRSLIVKYEYSYTVAQMNTGGQISNSKTSSIDSAMTLKISNTLQYSTQKCEKVTGELMRTEWRTMWTIS